MSKGNTEGKIVKQEPPASSSSGEANPAAEEPGMLEELKQELQSEIDEWVEGTGYTQGAMVAGAVATAVVEVFMPTAWWELIPIGKIPKLAKKGYQAAKALGKGTKAAEKVSNAVKSSKKAASTASKTSTKPKSGGKDSSVKGRGRKKKDPCKHLESGVPGASYKGGKYGSIRLGGASRGQHSHHVPAASASPLRRSQGPAIQMDVADHMQTASYDNVPGSAAYRSAQQALARQGPSGMLAAMMMDVKAIRGKFGNKYDSAIAQMFAWAKCKGYV